MTILTCLRFNLIISLLVLSSSIFIHANNIQVNGCLTGSVFEDYDCDGHLDIKEPGFEGLNVEVFDCFNVLIGTATTDAAGNWQLCGLTNGDKYRVEFVLSTAQDFWANPSHVGGSNGSDVQFVSSPAIGVNFAINSPADYCITDPELLIACYSTGAYDDPALAGEYSVVGLTYSYAGDPDGNINGTTTQSSNPHVTPPNYNPARPPANNIVAFSEVGTVYGVAKSETQDKVFVSSYIKAGSSLGPGESTGMIYQTENLLGSPITSSYVDLNAVFGANTFGPNPHPVATTNFQYPQDAATNAEIGKVGIGDIELSLDESELFVVNLYDRMLYVVPTSGALNTTTIQTFQIPNMGLPTETDAAGTPGTCAPGDVRPFGTGIDDMGNIYIGAVCSAESISAGVDAQPNDASYQLTAYVWKFDGTNFTLVLDESLRFNRDQPWNNNTYNTYDNHIDGSTPYHLDWEPWHDLSNPAIYNSSQPNQNEPMLADIEFDQNGDMILGMRDRSGDMTTLNVGYSTSGDIYRACLSGPSTWDMESNASCGGTTTNGQNGEGPGGGEFYYQDDQGDGIGNSGTGGLIVIPCANEVVSGSTDAVYLDSNGNEIFVPGAGGVQLYDNTTGEIVGAYNLFESGNDNSFFKASGIGDVEACCGTPPLQIGNYVWCDTYTTEWTSRCMRRPYRWFSCTAL